MTSETLISFRGVAKTYPGATRAAVRELSLDIPRGRFITLVGPSGCGKTTTMKMVNRLIEPTSGRIVLAGQDISTIDATSLRRRIGYVIQQVGLFPHQTIERNVAAVPRLLGWDKARIRDRVAELLDLVGVPVDEFGHRYPAQLSGGQAQRVGVARALAANPEILLMDEPFGAIDPITRVELQDELLRLQREMHKTILFVTHDIDEAMKMGDLIAVFDQTATLVQFGTPDDILASPATEFVQRFIGEGTGLHRLKLRRVRDLPLRAAPEQGVPDAPRLPATATLHQALDCLVRTSADCLIVTEQDSPQPMGVLTFADLQRALREAKTPTAEDAA
ncbi:ABC transporter ATP-binding protein [Propionicicella superfundia]|uniref:ABC transporter ATP-binding protein n=1 Tax=Propionicicella superfundia TaxID=348582 RepID=UPI00042A2A35|nr:ABC transporter ATP-binding protein [Propionicicella superfundia]